MKKTDARFWGKHLVSSKTPSTGNWYVAFRQPNEARAPYVRNTKTFETEIEAKQFARERLAEGCDVTAGTINPYTPKKTIGPEQISSWLAEN